MQTRNTETPKHPFRFYISYNKTTKISSRVERSNHNFQFAVLSLFQKAKPPLARFPGSRRWPPEDESDVVVLTAVNEQFSLVKLSSSTSSSMNICFDLHSTLQNALSPLKTFKTKTFKTKQKKNRSCNKKSELYWLTYTCRYLSLEEVSFCRENNVRENQNSDNNSHGGDRRRPWRWIC